MIKKSITILLLILLCILSIVALSSCNSTNKFSFAFVTDMHIVDSDNFTAENYTSYASRDKMIHLTEAIFNTTADDIIQSKTKFVLLGGDLTESGDLASHNSCIATLTRLKNAGVGVFVINGNHDIAQNTTQTDKITAETFSELYSDFGYGVALSKYENTLSYTADLDKNYRLIALDNVAHTVAVGQYKQDFTVDHASWALAQVDKCIADGKTPIIIAHKPFIQHFPIITEPFMDKKYYSLCKTFISSLADKGSNFSFTGHMHMQDIKSVTSKDGVFTDIESCSTAFYPSTYRNVVFKKDKVNITTKQIGNLNSKYLSQFSSEQEKIAVTNNFRDYCYNHMSTSISDIVGNATKPYGILGSKSFDGDLGQLMDILLPNVLDKVLNNPLYIKDEKDNMSLERLLQLYDVTMPATKYTSITNMAPFYVATLMGGDENIVDSTENNIIKLALKSMFYYINEQSNNIKLALSDSVTINIDLDKLFKEGILECYDSNFMPTIIAAVKGGIASSIINSILDSIQTDFSALNSFEVVISAYTNGHLRGITSYFVGKEIKIDDLFDDVFNIYLADFIFDQPHDDNNVEIAR